MPVASEGEQRLVIARILAFLLIGLLALLWGVLLVAAVLISGVGWGLIPFG